MPTYQYVCEKCEHEFEFVQPMAATALTVCPKEQCAQKRWGRGHVKRKITAGAGLIFKGSGFYITDYRSDSYKQAAKNDTAPAPKEAAKESTAPAKAETKPAAPKKTDS